MRGMNAARESKSASGSALTRATSTLQLEESCSIWRATSIEARYGWPLPPAGHRVQDAGRREQEAGDDDAENEARGFHFDSSLDSPASVLMNATIASLSSSGASRPS